MKQPSGVKPEKASWSELRRGVINIVPIENDGEPRSMIILTGLKTLFQKQLPKMPREYIARLVYDTNSRCLAIIKHGYLVVGGICFRPFPHRKFAEIVFFATNSADQVKVRRGFQISLAPPQPYTSRLTEFLPFRVMGVCSWTISNTMFGQPTRP